MTLLDMLMRRFVTVGHLGIIDHKGARHDYGPGGDPSATIRITDPTLYRTLFFNPELHAGEAYMDGTLVVEEGGIRGFLEVFAHNRDGLRSGAVRQRIKRTKKRFRKLMQRNVREASSKNVEAHYDLSNDLYRLFLDEDMQYSCAYWPTDLKPLDEIALEEAQLAKKRHIAAKLRLEPGQRVLDIGCGWGGMAMHLAREHDVEVVGVTLSHDQYALARERVEAVGLSDKIDIRLVDYRDVEGPFDRIVSVGMFEHVGVGHYEEYFSKIRDLLTVDGCALLHSIGRKGGPGTTGKWIRKYIFPGGYSPALSETFAEIEKAKLWVTDMEILRLHYAWTLAEWDRRFQANRDAVVAMKDERFARMWEFYLIISEFSFLYGKHMNFQIQLAKDVHALPATRNYMMDGPGLLA
ncbi:cyclopropane-fatty-acyl-phospholipid synthase family protein [uncultured Algimonas sp.]|uniref:SAM-dependent methyltransferase n=1 Tax=uncultured Algimonas sp. TaxID=1547920 RepID=UPI00261E4DFC|nr:cyclopropane-fatty-acyl-phospholipid synthase family protein [uncultured Algimonas sp.]